MSSGFHNFVLPLWQYFTVDTRAIESPHCYHVSRSISHNRNQSVPRGTSPLAIPPSFDLYLHLEGITPDLRIVKRLESQTGAWMRTRPDPPSTHHSFSHLVNRPVASLLTVNDGQQLYQEGCAID